MLYGLCLTYGTVYCTTFSQLKIIKMDHVVRSQHIECSFK